MAEGGERGPGVPWWVTAASLIAVPITVALITTVVTQHYTATEKSRDQDIRMIEIGLSLVKPDPNVDPKQIGAREWAIDVMERFSGVKFSDAARKSIVETSVPIDKTILQGPGPVVQPPIVSELPPLLERIGGNDYVAILDDPDHGPKWTTADGAELSFEEPMRDTIIRAAGANTTLIGGQIFAAYSGSASMGLAFAKWLKGVGKSVAPGTCFHLIGTYKDRFGGVLFGKIEDTDCP